MQEHEPLFCVFPYVEISEPILIRGELLVPHSALHTLELSESQRNDIDHIAAYFYWFSNTPVSTLTWVILESVSDPRRTNEFVNHIEEIRKVLGYLCCAPDDRPEYFWLLHGHYEETDYLLLRSETGIWKGFIDCVSFDTFSTSTEEHEDYFDGHRYSWNGGPWQSVIQGCRIYPRSHAVSRSFGLSNFLREAELMNHKLNILYLFSDESIEIEQQERIFDAVEWYNRSCKAEVSPDLSLISLAVALETLLGTRDLEDSEKRRISQKLFASIQLLVGKMNRLDNWFEQFYNARSRILHEGKWSQFRFSLPSRQSTSHPITREYGHLTHYGWIIFRICLNAVLEGLKRAADLDLKAKFFHHQERLEQMFSILSSKADPYNALLAVLDDVEALFQYPSSAIEDVSPQTVWNVAVKLSEQMLATGAITHDDQIDILQAVLSDDIALRPENNDLIIKHIKEIFERTNELPIEAVVKPALQALNAQPTPSIVDIKPRLEQILNDRRNAHISENLRQKLKNTIIVIEDLHYCTKLETIPNLAQSWGGSFIARQRLFTLFEGYTGFVHEVVEASKYKLRRYLISWD